MVNVSTLVYVLENLESKDGELTNLEELLGEEEAYVKRIFGKLDKSNFQVNPGLVKRILKTASTI
jgi:hypothetical protein